MLTSAAPGKPQTPLCEVDLTEGVVVRVTWPVVTPVDPLFPVLGYRVAYRAAGTTDAFAVGVIATKGLTTGVLKEIAKGNSYDIKVHSSPFCCAFGVRFPPCEVHFIRLLCLDGLGARIQHWWLGARK